MERRHWLDLYIVIFEMRSYRWTSFVSSKSDMDRAGLEIMEGMQVGWEWLGGMKSGKQRD